MNLSYNFFSSRIYYVKSLSFLGFHKHSIDKVLRDNLRYSLHIFIDKKMI